MGGVQISRPKGREDTVSGEVAPGTQSVVKREVLVWLSFCLAPGNLCSFLEHQFPTLLCQWGDN